jgi:hypothetical protein
VPQQVDTNSPNSRASRAIDPKPSRGAATAHPTCGSRLQPVFPGLALAHVTAFTGSTRTPFWHQALALEAAERQERARMAESQAATLGAARIASSRVPLLCTLKEANP